MKNLDDFINETLIELIKRKYNVNTDTYGICGSSCGGLASLYLGLKNINKYDFIFTFTPAIGLLNKSLLDIFFSNQIHRSDKFHSFKVITMKFRHHTFNFRTIKHI